MPARGCMLVQVLTALEFGGEDKREKSSRLLHHILLASQKLIRPYVTEVLQAVLPALQDANPNVAANVITVVGVLSTVGSAQVVVKQDAIFPLMIEAIQDLSSTTKRRVATSTLALMVQRTGTVIEPYKRYPDLLGVLLKGLQVEPAPGMCMMRHHFTCYDTCDTAVTDTCDIAVTDTIDTSVTDTCDTAIAVEAPQ